ncbi:MAG: hypothetical protein GC201_05990 [Alphaproteobacteria bacterium]|nr:hypothetical protein [Alphaproteobacteria bacterium]
MSRKGIPDWSQPVAAGDGLFFAWEEPRRVFAAPLDLAVAREPGGAPALSLELIRIDGGPSGPQVFGQLAVRFAGRFAIAERQQAVFALHPEAKVEPLAPLGGFLRFQAAGAVDLPDDLLAPRPLVWAGSGSLSFAARLGTAAANLLHGALVDGLVPVAAVAEVEARGMARRAPARASFDPARLSGVLAAAASEGTWRAGPIAEALLGIDDAAVFRIDGAATDATRLAAAQACADRLIGRWGRLAPAADPAKGTAFALDTAAMAAGSVTWDLSDEAVVPRGFVLASSPLETARLALADGFTLTRDAPVVPFATGLHVVSLYANLPPHRVGVLMMSTELRAPPFPPDRPQTVAAAATFRDGETAKSVSIRLSPAESLAFDYQTVAFVTGSGGAQRLAGPVLHHEGALLTIAPSSFPVRFVRLEAAPAVLDLMRLRVTCSGTRAGAPWSAAASLDQDTPSAALALPRDVDDAVLAVAATALDGSRTLAVDSRPAEDLYLDLSALPGWGPAKADLACAFDGDATVAAVECAPEDRLDDPDAVGLVRMTPSAPAREWRWLVTDPLRPGFCWRWFRPAGETAAPWSDPVDPAAGTLRLTSSARADAPSVETVR